MGRPYTPIRSGPLRMNPQQIYRVAKGVYSGYKVARNIFGTQKESKSTSGVVTTNQYDTKVQYRHKRMPRRKRRRWVKFAKKVKYVARQDLAMQTYVSNESCQATTSDSQQQELLAVHLYGLEGQGASGRENGTGDLNNLASKYGANGPKLRYMFDHAVMDITMANCSATTNGYNPQLEVDVYDIVYRDDTSSVSLNDLLESSLIKNTSNLIGTNQVDINQRGVTLFDFSNASAAVKMKILRKTKIFLGSNQSATYQIRDNKKRKYNGVEVVDNQGGFIYPGYTRTLAFVFKTVTNNGTGGLPQNNIGTLKVGNTRTYYYKFEEQSQAANGYN